MGENQSVAMGDDLPTESDVGSDGSLPSLASEGLGEPDHVVSWHCHCKDGPCVPPNSDIETGCKVLREGLLACEPEVRRRRVWLSLRELCVVKQIPKGTYLINDSPELQKDLAEGSPGGQWNFACFAGGCALRWPTCRWP